MRMLKSAGWHILLNESQEAKMAETGTAPKQVKDKIERAYNVTAGVAKFAMFALKMLGT